MPKARSQSLLRQVRVLTHLIYHHIYVPGVVSIPSSSGPRSNGPVPGPFTFPSRVSIPSSSGPRSNAWTSPRRPGSVSQSLLRQVRVLTLVGVNLRKAPRLNPFFVRSAF